MLAEHDRWIAALAAPPAHIPSSRCHILSHTMGSYDTLTAANLFIRIAARHRFRSVAAARLRQHPKQWWRQTGSNRRPHACKARALPTELCPRRTFARAEGSQGRLAVRAHARGSQGDGRRRRRLRQPETMVGLGRLERPTSPLSGVRSNHLSYRPSMIDAHRDERRSRSRYPDGERETRTAPAPPKGPDWPLLSK